MLIRQQRAVKIKELARIAFSVVGEACVRASGAVKSFRIYFDINFVTSTDKSEEEKKC
jgi:hypothetical protein